MGRKRWLKKARLRAKKAATEQHARWLVEHPVRTKRFLDRFEACATAVSEGRIEDTAASKLAFCRQWDADNAVP